MLSPLKLGNLLLQEGLITEAQLQRAMELQQSNGGTLGQVLASLNFLSEQQFLDFFAKQLKVPFFDLKNYVVNSKLCHALPEFLARLYHALIIEKQTDHYLVAMVDPSNVLAIDQFNQVLDLPIRPVLVNEQDLNRVLDIAYRRTEDISTFAQALSQELEEGQDKIIDKSVVDVVDAPIIHLIESLLEDAAQVNATDIHIEPNVEGVRFRLRIDGALQEQRVNETAIMPAIASRLKLMAGLNIAEKRLPQDGRFSARIQDKKFDVRLSFMPTPFGESIVLRLLHQSEGITHLEQTGMSGQVLENFRHLLKKPHGLILVTGPTGSGKSTTLHAGLHELNRPEIQIITVEDPIEYFLSWAVQIQVNEKIGLDFATVLRGIVRQDPDVLLIGEMRDKETAAIGLRAALTGRLVLSTLHTNDSTGAISRLEDLGVENYMIGATVQGILAQRLVRQNCPHCIAEDTFSSDQKIWLSKLEIKLDGVQFKKGQGCSFCYNTGYQGRVGIFELLTFNEAMSEALRNNDHLAFYKLAQQSLDGQLLAQDACRLAIQGVTSIEEVMNVVNEGY